MRIHTADSFTDGWGEWIVLPHRAVDWARVPHGEPNAACVGGVKPNEPTRVGEGCASKPVWVVLDYEGCAWPLCAEHGDTDNPFFTGGDGEPDPFLKPNNEDLTPIQRLWAWGPDLPVHGPAAVQAINNESKED